jgi:hypothetical protein
MSDSRLRKLAADIIRVVRKRPLSARDAGTGINPILIGDVAKAIKAGTRREISREIDRSKAAAKPVE